MYQEETTPSISCRPPGKLGSLLFGTSSTSDPAIDTSSIYSSQQTPSMRHATYADLADIFQRLHEYHLFEILDQHHFWLSDYDDSINEFLLLRALHVSEEFHSKVSAIAYEDWMYFPSLMVERICLASE